MLTSVCLALCRAVHVRPARGAEGRSTALPAAAPSRCGQTLHPPLLLRDTAAPLRAPAAHQHLNPGRPPPPPVSGGPGGRAAARGGPEREAGMAGMAGMVGMAGMAGVQETPGARGTLAHLRPPPRALRHKMAEDAGRAQAHGRGSAPGPRPHHVTGWAGSGPTSRAWVMQRARRIPGSSGTSSSRRHRARTSFRCARPRKGVRELPPLPELLRQLEWEWDNQRGC